MPRKRTRTLTVQGKTLTLADWVKLYPSLNLKSINTRYTDPELTDEEKLFGKNKTVPQNERKVQLKNIVDAAISYSLPAITDRIIHELDSLVKLEIANNSMPAMPNLLGGNWYSSLYAMSISEALSNGSTVADIFEILHEEKIPDKANRLKMLDIEADDESENLTVREIRQLLSVAN